MASNVPRMGRGKLILQLMKEHDERLRARREEIEGQTDPNSKGTQTDERKDRPVAVVKPNTHLPDRGSHYRELRTSTTSV